LVAHPATEGANATTAHKQIAVALRLPVQNWHSSNREFLFHVNLKNVHTEPHRSANRWQKLLS